MFKLLTLNMLSLHLCSVVFEPRLFISLDNCLLCHSFFLETICKHMILVTQFLLCILLMRLSILWRLYAVPIQWRPDSICATGRAPFLASTALLDWGIHRSSETLNGYRVVCNPTCTYTHNQNNHSQKLSSVA